MDGKRTSQEEAIRSTGSTHDPKKGGAKTAFEPYATQTKTILCLKINFRFVLHVIIVNLPSLLKPHFRLRDLRLLVLVSLP